MTLEEKLGQLIQYTNAQPDLRSLVTKGAVGCVFNLNGAAKTNALQHAAVDESRLKIPLLFAHDVIHGYRTIFPIPLAIASSWDPAAAELASGIAAREASASGIRWTFAPMVDIARDPRWGRITEGAGEDPFLGSRMAAAYVRGFQGSDLAAPDSIMACAKHFAAYGGAEAGRDYNTVDMSERTLREVYLPPYKAAVDAGVRTIMTAFNSLNGVPSTANPFLLKTILRDEWKFRGFVDSDYQAIEQLIPHGIAATKQEAARKAIKAGVDMDMVDASYLTLANAVKEGRLSESVIDSSVRRILRAKFALGLFDRPHVDEQREAAILLATEHRGTARRIAHESIVLLKNDGALLPLSKSGETIAVIGPLAGSKADMLGSWHALGRAEETISVLEGLRAKVSALTYAKGDDIAEALAVAQKAGVVVLVLGEEETMSGEAASRAFLDLPGKQQQLLETIVATGKPVALVILSGRPLTISWAAEHVRAIVWAWFLGTEGGNALADVLFGDVNPSGKLPVTFPRSAGQIPIYYAQLPTGRPENPSDKYTSKYIDSPNTPLYPFGYGLSYTRFEYTNLHVEPFTVSIEVRNAGERAGDEIVQLYVRKAVSSVSRPLKQLKGFQRVTLAPGEKRRVEFTIARDDLRFWTEAGWKLERGTYKVWAGPSSAEGLEGTFEVK